ncbi:MAG: Do family serine endopeptidase [Spirochaetales bacterium]|nr:Do family serine endopeptidase [Spirochaetales bacterium]
MKSTVHHIKVRTALGVIAVLFFSLFFSACFLFRGVTTNGEGRIGPSPEDVRTLERAQDAFRRVAGEVVPVVVSINVNDISGGENPWDFFFQDPEKDQGKPKERDYERYGMGSGIIVDKKDGFYYILTNYHVIRGGKQIQVVLSDEREYVAAVVGIDERIDMAVVSIKTDADLPVAHLGDSDTLKVGDWVIAVGNPYGWQSSVTSGIVSYLGRRLDRNANLSNVSDFIQTDAGINPGNSGGALVNVHGEVIGVNTWITSPTGGSIGIGFAIPINNAKKLVHDLVIAGKVQYGWLGVSIYQMITSDAEKELGIYKRKGAFVNYVIKDTPAWRGGILPGDFITSVNGTRIADANHFVQVVSELNPGVPLTFNVIRLGKEKTLSFALGYRPAESAISSMSDISWPGFVSLPLSGPVREKYKIPTGEKGVVVFYVEQGTPAFTAGFHAGDIVKRINVYEIHNLMDFYGALNDATADTLEISVKRGGGDETIVLDR